MTLSISIELIEETVVDDKVGAETKSYFLLLGLGWVVRNATLAEAETEDATRRQVKRRILPDLSCRPPTAGHRRVCVSLNVYFQHFLQSRCFTLFDFDSV